MTMRHRAWLVVGLLAAAWSAAPAQRQETLDRIVAVVDNEIILESELNAQVQFLALNNRMDPATPGLRDQVLQNMINERLIIAKAIEDSVTVSDDEVQQQLDASIQQRIQQVGSEARLEELYGMPLSRIKREYRDEMRKSLLAQRLQQQRFGSANIGRFEVEEFYRSYKDSLPRVPEELELSRIFTSPRASGGARAAARAKAEALLDSLRGGADFQTMARRHSQDGGSAPQGGDLGLVRRGQFVKEFESAVFALAEGELSGVVESDFGFHIIQLVDRRGDAVHARHILIRVGKTADSDSATVRLLDSLRTVALEKRNFAELAKKFSEDKETNLLGGSLGTIELDQIDKTWYPYVSVLTEGQISVPFRVTTAASYGFQIILMRKRIPAHVMTLEADYHKIEALALNYKRSKDYQNWMNELRSRIYWQIKDTSQ